MTKYENRSLWISFFALTVSFLSPVITYIYLDTAEKAIANRAKMRLFSFQRSHDSADPNAFTFNVKNVGKLPARDLQLSLLYAGQVPAKVVAFDPVAPSETVKNQQQVDVKLKSAVAPGDTIKIEIFGRPMSAILYSEFGEQTVFAFPDVYNQHTQTIR